MDELIEKFESLRAMSMAHHDVLVALVASHPEKRLFRQAYGALTERRLADWDAKSSGIIQSVEDQILLACSQTTDGSSSPDG